ncbi:AtpZ/AtpI family protein [Desertivirga xinjiangensis]|uniref:AtpZ/AtpI family protein n=1 Tax=Desertivirga xinjiangensis TaxID=539206 RepID=UPI00210960DE|nr:AtpZ/AtpI family protein [Pedobacter xinjiangensis]
MKQLDDEDMLKKRKRDVSTYAKYSAMGFQMFGIICAFTYAGYRLDSSRQMDTPLFTAFFSLLGVFISLYLVIRSIKKLEP